MPSLPPSTTKTEAVRKNDTHSVVWPWREKENHQLHTQHHAPTKLSAATQTVVMAAIGAWLFWKVDNRVLGIVTWSLASIILTSAFFCPPAYTRLNQFGKGIGKWVGILLTWGLLAPFYFLCFLPLHLAQIIRRKDPLSRPCPTTQSTYWVPHKPISNPAQYTKQF